VWGYAGGGGFYPNVGRCGRFSPPVEPQKGATAIAKIARWDASPPLTPRAHRQSGKERWSSPAKQSQPPDRGQGVGWIGEGLVWPSNGDLNAFERRLRTTTSRNRRTSPPATAGIPPSRTSLQSRPEGAGEFGSEPSQFDLFRDPSARPAWM